MHANIPNPDEYTPDIVAAIQKGIEYRQDRQRDMAQQLVILKAVLGTHQGASGAFNTLSPLIHAYAGRPIKAFQEPELSAKAN